MPHGVEVSRLGGVLHVVLNAPERMNALSKAVLTDLGAALAEIDESVVGVVISGSGDAFSAGADFGDLTGTSADIAYDDRVAAVTKRIRELPVVVIAALEGPCIGAGADLALSCDLRVAGVGSYLMVPAVRLGILYNPETVDRLRRAYPRDVIRRLLLLAGRFDSDDALRAGLVSLVVPRGEAVKRALDLYDGTTTDHLAAVAATKALLNVQEVGEYDSLVWDERRRSLLDSPERRAAVTRAKRTHTEKES